MLHRAGLLESNVGWLQSDTVFTGAHVLGDRAAFAAKDFVTRLEFGDFATNCFDYTGEVLPDNLYAVTAGEPHITVVPTKDRGDLLVSYLSEAMEMAGRLLDSHQPKEIDQP